MTGRVTEWWSKRSTPQKAMVGAGVALGLFFILGGGSRASRVVAIARAQLGLREIPFGSNGGPEVAKFTGGREESWCAHFVAWVHRQAGAPLPGDVVPTPNRYNPRASVADTMNVAKQRGAFVPAWETPRPGDVIFYSGHTGIVEDVTPTHVRTIEGNTGNGVMRIATPRSASKILGYGRFV